MVQRFRYQGLQGFEGFRGSDIKDYKDFEDHWQERLERKIGTMIRKEQGLDSRIGIRWSG